VIAAALSLVLTVVEVRVQPGVARPGDAVMIEVAGTSQPPAGKLGTDPLVFLPLGKAWVAIIGLSVDHPPGILDLEIMVGGEAQTELIEGELEVITPDFRRRQLTVGKRFTSPSKKDRAHSAADQVAFNEAFDRDFEPWTFSQPFAWPRVANITAPFGDLRLLNGKKQSQHFGADLNGDIGDPIFAANDGEVVMIRNCFASGNTVLLHHGGRLFTSYFHLSKTTVAMGQKVSRGQRLGLVGKTGRVTGPHLHFGCKLDGKWVDPESVLRLEVAPQPSPDAGVSAQP
jgi:Peptidase family M23